MTQMKIYHRFSWILLLVLLKCSSCEIFLMRHQYESDSVELSCFYNGPQTDSVGLSWVLPSTTKNIHDRMERWKHSMNASVQGHFEFYGHIWIKSSLLTMPPPNILPPVLDERWNAFQTIQTGPDIKMTPIKFSTDRIHFSVLAKADAHVFLHTGSKAHDSATYWFGLDSRLTSGSFLRKCSNGIPESLVPSSHECAVLRASHTNIHALQDGKEWVHFTIQFSNGERSTSRAIKLSMVNPKDDVLKSLATLTYTDMAPFTDLNYISFRTEGTAGLWKLHDFPIVYHNGRGDGEGFNVFRSMFSKSICLQVFYFFRPDFGNASIRQRNGRKLMDLEPSKRGWTMQKIHVDISPPQDYIHFVPPIGNFIKNGAAFVISQPFRLCGEDEFLVSKINVSVSEANNAKCVNLVNHQYAIMKNETGEINIFADCPEGKFSKSCNISCGRVVGDSHCSGKIICDNSKCSCLSQYKPTSLWNTTCREHIPTDEGTVEPEPDEQEISSVTETFIDDDSLEILSVDALEATETSQVCCDAKDVAIIVITLLLIISVLSNIMVIKKWGGATIDRLHSVGVRWRANTSRLIEPDEVIS